MNSFYLLFLHMVDLLTTKLDICIPPCITSLPVKLPLWNANFTMFQILKAAVLFQNLKTTGVFWFGVHVFQ